MKRILFIIFVLVLLTSCSKLLLDFEEHPRGENKFDPMGPTPPTQENDGSWLYMVYLDAANNLEEAGLADLEEMTKTDFTGYSGKTIDIIILMDRIAGYSAADGDWQGAKIIRLLPNGNKTYLTNRALGITNTSGVDEINMGDPNTLRDFIKFCINKYGAGKDYFLLDLWNHGGGWRNDGNSLNDIKKAICWDDDNGSKALYMNEVQTALAQAGKKLDIIYMDACLMQMAEVNYELRNWTHYLVASEETVPGNGGDYIDILTRFKDNLLGKHSPYLFSYELVSSYRNQYNATSDTTLSAIDETKLSVFMTALDSFASSLTNLNSSKIKDIRNNTKSFAYPDQADLYDFAQKCNENISGGVAGASEVMSAIDNLMVKEYHHASSMSTCHGLAIYFPSNPSQADVPAYCNDNTRDMVADQRKWVDFIRWWKRH